MIKKIAVVEDEESLQRVLIEWLNSEGYDAVGYTSGKDAIEAIPDSNFDLVLLDIILPGASGFEVLQSLRENESTKNLPVIILSNLGEEDNKDKALSLGANGFLVKADFQLKEIKEVIKRFEDTK